MNERTGTVADRLARLGLQLPPPPAPVAAFEPYVRHGGTIYISGQIATRDGRLVAAGRLGAEVDLVAGQDAARACAVNVLAQLQAAAGGLDAVTRLVKLTVFVACTGDFTRSRRLLTAPRSCCLTSWARPGHMPVRPSGSPRCPWAPRSRWRPSRRSAPAPLTRRRSRDDRGDAGRTRSRPGQR